MALMQHRTGKKAKEVTYLTNKEKIYELVKKGTILANNQKTPDTIGVTAEEISNALGLKRNYVSSLLNELNREQKLIKVNTRPVHFIDKNVFEERTGKNAAENLIYGSFEELFEENSQTKEKDLCNVHLTGQNPFSKFIGFDGSIKYQIEQCKAAVKYPPNGIPILINGQTGTGKSFLAQLMFEYALQNEIIQPEAPFLIFNCAEYANNPELLSANLFGYAKGAFTGAEKDFKGIIEQADGGYLFLDEIHRLPPEGQEKLFLFMDKGIFRRMGESSGWRKASVRFIFATTEKPETFLLDTFSRRIPIVITIPPLKERPIAEKVQLIYIFFKQEALSIKKNLRISKQALRVLVNSDFKGNVGQLKNDIKLACARAYNDYSNKNQARDYIDINLMMLPEHLSHNYITDENISESTISEMLTDDLIIKASQDDSPDVFSLINKKQAETYKIFFNDIIQLSKALQVESNRDAVLDKIAVVIDDFFDYLILGSMKPYAANDTRNIRFDTILAAVHNAFGIIKNKYNLRYYDNVGYKIAGFINQSIEYRYLIDINGYDVKSNKYLENIKRLFPEECGASEKISDFLRTALDISLTPFEIYIITLYLLSMKKSEVPKRPKAVVIAHGFSTASSIANVANHLLGENIFESFDMPIDVRTEEIVKKLKQYMQEVNTSYGIIILVDMGSLEEIYEGLESISDGVIGIINNITTQLALDAGSQILQGLSVEETISKVTGNHRLNYKLIKPTAKKKKAIVTTCITGIGTAMRIKDLMVKSLGEYSNLLEVIPVDYLELKNKGTKAGTLNSFDVIAIIGTKNPEVDFAPYYSLEDIISGKREEEFGKLFKNIIPEDGIMQLNQSIIKYFSLENVLKHITILNPDKILDHVEAAIEILQYELKVKFTNDIKICLYVHVSCLIERLVTKTQIGGLDPELLFNFEKQNKDFIENVKKSFKDIEKLYNVDIPLSEVYFIYLMLEGKL